MKERGFTLIELIIAGLLVGAVFLFTGDFLLSVMKMLQRNSDTMFVEMDLLAVKQEMSRSYARATGVHFVQSGPGRPGFSVYRNGAIVLATDQRTCDEGFDPSTSAQPANRTEFRIVCCEPALTVSIVPPWGGGGTVTSACKLSEGLSVETVSGAGSSTQCFPNIKEMNVVQQGTDFVRGAPLYHHSLGITAAIALPGAKGATEARQYLEFYDAIGIGGSQLNVVCQGPNLRFQ